MSQYFEGHRLTREEVAAHAHWHRWNSAKELPTLNLRPEIRRQLCSQAAEARRALTQKKLAAFSKRALVRAAVLAHLKRVQEHIGFDGRLDRTIQNMEVARQSFTINVRPADGKVIRRWDRKTGNARVDPDDAREEAARFSRRVSPAVMGMVSEGDRVTYAVFTMPNFAPGKLRHGCITIYRRFSNLLRRCKRGKVPGCSGIRGAAVVLEAPLSCHGDWNVHLNVLLVHDGFIDYKVLRAAWHWNVELRPIIATEEGIASALREIIKYSVQAVAEKSSSKAAAGNSRAPAFVEWPLKEAAEWWFAFQRFRRSRTYGALFRLPKPEKLDLGEFVCVGMGEWMGPRRGFEVRFPLLDLIPGDKFATENEFKDLLPDLSTVWARDGPSSAHGAAWLRPPVGALAGPAGAHARFADFQGTA